MAVLLSRLFQMSLWGSILAAIILIMKRLIGERLSAVFHYVVWSILILRLAIPYSPGYVQPLEVTESEQPPLTRQAAETAQAEQDMIAAMQEGLQFANGKGNTLSDSSLSNDIPEIMDNKQPWPFRLTNSEYSSRPEDQRNSLPVIHKLLCWVYVSGIGVYLFMILLSLCRYRMELLPDEQPEAICAIFAEERIRFGLSSRIRLRIAVSGSPYASGVLCPCVTIPLALTTDFEEADLRAVFRHELTHIRYGDTVLRVLLVTLQGIYWFNPLIWYAFACIRRDGEYACDARVLHRSSHAEQLSYGKALLNVAELYTTKASVLYSTFAVRPLRRRIEKIIAYRPAQWWKNLAAIPLALVCMTAGIVVSAQSIEVLTLDAKGLDDERAWKWTLEYPMLAELPDEDMALYAVDAALLDRGDYSDWTYSGRVALRQGDEVQLCDWEQTYANRWPEMVSGDYDQNGSREYAFTDYDYASFVGERDGTLRIVKRSANGIWDGAVKLEGYEVLEQVSRQFTAGEAADGELIFTLNGEPCRIALPEDLQKKPLLRLELLPYVRFHTEGNGLSVSIAIGAYFDKHPVFAGYLNAPITYSKDTLTVGAAAFAGSLFQDYPEDWLRLYDEETGLTLGLPPRWESNFINTGPHDLYNTGHCVFELYEAYNYELPFLYDDVHCGFLLNFLQEKQAYEDFYLFLGYRNNQAIGYNYPHGVEYSPDDPEARVRYEPLGMDEHEVVSRFVVANHLSVKQRLDYWNMMI